METNYNLWTYAIYLPLMFYITVWIGWVCYKNGEIYLKRIFQLEPHIVAPLNKIFLTGYYLLNLGYTTVMVRFWPKVDSILEIFNTLSTRVGLLILGLSAMHYINIAATAWFAKRVKINS